ncbi:MAG TPA: ThiF family adenylyltransferase [Solirubrobacteraceae bacterium]|nr:ThiF family adenylyltransferase [Solirubrobacteraceae bacterium]
MHRHPSSDLGALDGHSLYDRQIRFLSFYEDAMISGLELNHNLQDRTVVIPGIGGLGGWIALLCARLGVRRIIGIDPDRVELSNLHRQILYANADIGELKVVAAERRIKEVDPDIEYVGHPVFISKSDDVLPIIEGADLVINDFPLLPSFMQASKSVATAALQARVPCLNMPMAQCLGPLTVPGETACIDCAMDQLRSKFQIDYALRANTPVGARNGLLGALAPRQAIQGGFAAWEALRFLSGIDRPPTLDGIAFVDIGAYANHQFLRLTRNDKCPTCGGIDPVAIGTATVLGSTASPSPDAWRRN